MNGILKPIRTFKLSISLFIVGVLVFVFEFTKPSINSDADLINIEGTLSHYSFEQYFELKNEKTEYYLWLNEYPCKFQISADFEPFFYKSGFENEINPGDKISILIPLVSQIDLSNSQETVRLFSINKYSTNYLNKNDALKAYNSHMLKLLGLIALVISLVSFFIKRKNYRQH